ncbi:hypothetical protein GCM10017688_52250 [Streptomyces ramulosus]
MLLERVGVCWCAGAPTCRFADVLVCRRARTAALPLLARFFASVVARSLGCLFSALRSPLSALPHRLGFVRVRPVVSSCAAAPHRPGPSRLPCFSFRCATAVREPVSARFYGRK